LNAEQIQEITVWAKNAWENLDNISKPKDMFDAGKDRIDTYI